MMQPPHSKLLFNEAADLLDTANLETNRPKEDAVNFLVCQKARQSIGKLLSSYILANGGSVGKSEKNSDLFDKCVEIDPQFKSIPMNNLDCNLDDNEDQSIYCLSHSKTMTCLEVANRIREMVESKVEEL